MKGDLEESFNKGGSTLKRTLNADREFMDANGEMFSLPGRRSVCPRWAFDDQSSDLDGEGKKYSRASWMRFSPPPVHSTIFEVVES